MEPNWIKYARDAMPSWIDQEEEKVAWLVCYQQVYFSILKKKCLFLDDLPLVAKQVEEEYSKQYKKEKMYGKEAIGARTQD